MSGARPRQARDIALVDAIDAFQRTPFDGKVWRVCRAGRDPLPGSPSRSRWCNGAFDILYTSATRDGAIAEVFSFLNLQPVFPSSLRYIAHELAVRNCKMLSLSDLPTLQQLGVDMARYRERGYALTQEIADAAYFLGFDGLIAPSAPSECMNIMLFTDRLDAGNVSLTRSEAAPIDWRAQRPRLRK